jgi:1,2-phenylacetyl-CoA epoxidase catalytic subunit
MSSRIMVFERRILSLALIEKELYQLYTNLSEKVEDVAAKTLFAYIATDSLKHSTILVKIVEEVGGSKAREEDCDENIRYNRELIATLSKDVSNSKKIDREELISLVGTLVGFESLLLNEYSKAFRLETTRFSKDERNKNHETELNIFNLIIGDEEQHQRILRSIVSFCDKKLDFKNDAPIVKYQNPDAWYIPPT